MNYTLKIKFKGETLDINKIVVVIVTQLKEGLVCLERDEGSLKCVWQRIPNELDEIISVFALEGHIQFVTNISRSEPNKEKRYN